MEFEKYLRASDDANTDQGEAGEEQEGKQP
jgi:hypothetical protein